MVEQPRPRAVMKPLRPTAGYSRLGFVDFVAERQALLLRRRDASPPWTSDFILGNARFCNIDRRDDAVTAELLVSAQECWSLRERVLLILALRFTSSRRGEAAKIAALLTLDRDATSTLSRLRAALVAGEVQCGANTYQMSLNRKQVATVIEAAADAVVARISKSGPFVDVAEASDFVAEAMTCGKRPQFAANEAAKDFQYMDGMMAGGSSRRCHLGPGARKGLVLVRASLPPLSSLSEAAAVQACRDMLASHGDGRRRPLEWIETIDVEQALCEYAKYINYCENGISAAKRYQPSPAKAASAPCGAPPPEEETHEETQQPGHDKRDRKRKGEPNIVDCPNAQRRRPARR